SGSHRTITRRATGISLAATILAKVCRQSDASRDAEGQRQACSRMVQASLKIPAPAPLRVRLSSNAKCGTTWDNGISLRYDDNLRWMSPISLNPYAKLFFTFSGNSTVVLGKVP